jgi:hypothetical protein
MADDADLIALLHVAGEHLSVLIRQAYAFGRKAGENAAKERVLSVFAASDQTATIETKNRQRGGSMAEMATVSRPLREAIFAMNIGRTGVGPKDVLEFIKLQPSMEFDISQNRAGIKTLEKRGDLVRVSRGRYRPSAQLLGESEDQETEAPNSGELFGAPKANGAEPLHP